MKKIAVIGLGFGDEGKGLSTSFLCNKYPGIVIRTNGGHQAGHTVVFNGFKHVFSQFGSGTLQGNPTYISKNCTIYPSALLKEYQLLKKFNPLLYIDPLTMITTPLDKINNQIDLEQVSNGTVGVGFGKTIERNENFYNLYFQDLFYPSILEEKLNSIYYNYYKCGKNIDFQEFIEDCKKLIETKGIKMFQYKDLQHLFKNQIFEGSQGILLDQHHGFFPNVTRSNTTSKNIIELAPDLDEIYYVTRTYQTRHGNGYMSSHLDKPNLINHENETNVTDPFQGTFRYCNLDIELLRYAIQCDSNYSGNLIKKNLIITCNDQYSLTEKKLREIENIIYFNNIYLSNGPSLSDITQIKN